MESEKAEGIDGKTWTSVDKWLWDSINDEIYRQNKTKKEIAERCGFEKSVMFEYNNLAILILLCKELNVSADYLLFGKKK